MPKIVRNEIEYSSTTSTANQISYLNTTSGLSATNVQGAIDEVNSDVNSITPTIASSTSTLAVNDTYQIPASVMSHNMILIQMYRYSRGGSVLFDKATLGNLGGSAFIPCAATGYGWEITVSSTGLITLTKLVSGTGEPTVRVVGFF